MLTAEQMEKSHRLWDALVDYSATKVDEALNHLMATMRDWLGARDVVWVGAARLQHGTRARKDRQHGWRGLVFRHLLASPETYLRSARAASEQDRNPAMTTCALAATTGRLRVHRLRDGFVDFEAFKQTAHYRMIFVELGISDRMFVGVPVNADAESFILFDHYRPGGRFSDEDAEWVAYTMRGLKWFHRELMLSHGLLLANAPLTATERRIVRLLLTDRTEGEIAAELGQSPHTTHGHVKEILRKYGVRGRAGLTALWLRSG